ncbi:nucleolar protein 16-like [Paramacrobiotus metropolitanus]|uniref:nucleolar protein 16-like n=1 Tax=Paramacrobiotus metropolitanus TaxID=2943436 RepID=UPI0024459D0E|nr:nucleolar protein 16-like [Paramacrobiotus metropolitanus]XP_055337437.1 nucleolar protein 16-like [Paramacrobiotus metropolitanus]
MGKARSKVKRVKAYSYTTDRKKLWKKRKQVPHIKCTEIKEAWNAKKSIDQNLRHMGLAVDANKTLQIEDTKVRLLGKNTKKKAEKVDGDVEMGESSVAEILQKSAATPQESGMKLSEPEAEFCMLMIEKYGQDYKAMARDADNYYQETPKQIRRKIQTFRRFPGPHANFLKRKGLSQMDVDETEI